MNRCPVCGRGEKQADHLKCRANAFKNAAAQMGFTAQPDRLEVTDFLRDTLQWAVAEIERLRKENAELQELADAVHHERRYDH